MKDIVVYVAGPYTKPDPCINTHNAVNVGNQLLEKGIPCIIPHMSHFWHTMYPQPYRSWMELDFILLRRSNLLVRLPGESSGADEEVALAESLKLPIVIASSVDTAADEVYEYLQSSGMLK
jgi:hypothetical protein